MSRGLRSAFTVAQTAMAGPSRQVVRPVSVPSPTHLSRRTAFSLNTFIPDWMRRRQDAEREKTIAAREKPEQAAAPIAESTSDNIFEEIEKETVQEAKRQDKRRMQFKEHKYTSGKHKMSPQKLKLLATQISGLPVDEAILQMQFSNKRAASWIKSNLALARDHAIWYKGATREKLVVSEAIVNKEVFGAKQLDIKARGRFGIKRHPYSRLVVILRHGKTQAEKDAIYFKKETNRRVRSATWVREDQKLPRKFNNTLAW